MERDTARLSNLVVEKSIMNVGSGLENVHHTKREDMVLIFTYTKHRRLNRKQHKYTLENIGT